MEKGKILFNGNEKKIYATKNSDEVLIHYTDVITCYNSVKRAKIIGKGAVTNQISSILFEYLTKKGMKTHFIRRVNDCDQLCRKVNVIPLEFVARTRAAGEMSHRFRMDEGTKLNRLVIDVYLNDNSLGNPLINNYHVVTLDIATAEELQEMYRQVREVFAMLAELCIESHLELVDLKLEFGRDKDGILIISDEISPDTCRFWDADTGTKLDKDRFRHDMSDVLASYKEVLKRLNGLELRD